MCSWVELGDGSLTMADLMDMHRSLNLKDYLTATAEKQAKGRE
jgi:hypothetical protein